MNQFRFVRRVVCTSWLLTLIATTSINLRAAEPAVAVKAAAAGFEWQSLEIPRALVAVGVWGDMFKWREALHYQGIEYDDGYRYQNGYHQPAVQMVNIPSALADYQKYSTVVLINVDAPALGKERLESIRQFVEQGGGLVVLGGYWAYERGAYAGTPLEELLPVALQPRGEVPNARSGVRLTAKSAADWKWQADFEASPLAFYFHALTAKPQAKAILNAGDAEVMFAGEFGAGRVVACGLTTNGEPSANQLAFWNWSDWPAVLGQAVDWAGANRPLQVDEAQVVKLSPIDADEAEKLRLDFQPLSKEIVARFVAVPTAPAADAIFTLVFPENKQKVELTAELVDALASQAQPEWVATLERAADSLNPNLDERNVALELLGATKTSTAAQRLLNALDDADVAVGAIAGLRRLEEPSHRVALLRLFERSVASSDFRNYDLESASNAAAGVKGRIAVNSAIALYHLGDAAGIERILELHRELRLLRRIFFNAAKRRVVETDPTGVAIRATIWKKALDFSALEQQLLEQAGPIPTSQQAAFVAAAKAATQSEDVLWLAAALHRTPPGTDWSEISQSKDGILRRLASVKSARE